MDLDHDACYRALAQRDSRFDGRFFTAVEDDRHLLPSGLPRAHAPGQERELLSDRRGRARSGLPTVLALPPGDCA